MENIYVYLINMSCKIKECVTANSDGSYTVLINAALSHEARITEYLHALQHIYGDDFSKENADAIERMAHERKEFLYDY